MAIVWVLIAAAAVYTLFVLLILTGNGFTRIGPFPISVRNLWRNSRVLAVILALLILVSPRARSFARQWIGSHRGLHADRGGRGVSHVAGS